MIHRSILSSALILKQLSLLPVSFILFSFACSEEPKVIESAVHETETALVVTRENYPTVETSRQFETQIKNAGGINKLNRFDGVAKLDDQPIIRLNQDTVYTMGVVDASKGATVTVPDSGEREIERKLAA